MTQPDPYAEQRAQALADMAGVEAALYTAYLDMMTGWLAHVGAQVLSAGVTTLALQPDPYTVFASTPLWTELVDAFTAQVVEQALRPGYASVLGHGVVFSTRPYVDAYIAQVRNQLVGVPDQVFGMISRITAQAAQAGASIPDVTEQVSQLFSVTATPLWPGRARTVARTETHRAYVGGRHDAFAVLVEMDPDGDWVHRWLSTDDARTRPTHDEADGQVQPWGHPFTVGGFQLHMPGDPEGPPQETINCRCVELLETADEPTRMDDRQTRRGSAASLAAGGRTLAMLASGADDLCSLVACRITGKPGLCKGQHRGGYEPGTVIDPAGNQGVQTVEAARAKSAAAAADRVAVLMASWPPELRARAARALAAYRHSQGVHQRASDTEQAKTLRHQAQADAARRQAEADAKQQKSLDGRTARRRKGSGTLLPYQTATKL